MIISRHNRAVSITMCAAVLAFSIMGAAGCFNVPGKLPSGTWNYALLINGNRVGTAVISFRAEGDALVSTTELTMKAGAVTNVSKQIVTETKDFRPVKLESYNRIVTGSGTQEINTVAVFNGRKVELVTGSEKTTFEIDRDFRLEGNFMLSQLIMGKFKKGMIVESWIYEPSIDPETPVLMKARVEGRENVLIGGRELAAVRVIEYIARVKSFDMFIDEKGVLLKADLTMLNTNIQLVRE
ncbi:MAG TPA: hypothetical protein PKY31_07990 [Spirochaetota bacterium]|nr:hypothetical protein [Spirochaetota bacterium]